MVTSRMRTTHYATKRATVVSTKETTEWQTKTETHMSTVQTTLYHTATETLPGITTVITTTTTAPGETKSSLWCPCPLMDHSLNFDYNANHHLSAYVDMHCHRSAFHCLPDYHTAWCYFNVHSDDWINADRHDLIPHAATDCDECVNSRRSAHPIVLFFSFSFANMMTAVTITKVQTLPASTVFETTSITGYHMTTLTSTLAPSTITRYATTTLPGITTTIVSTEGPSTITSHQVSTLPGVTIVSTSTAPASTIAKVWKKIKSGQD